MKLSRLIVVTISLVFMAAGVNTALAKGSEIKFASVVIGINQSASNGESLTVTIHDITVNVIVNRDTEILESGEEIDLVDVSAGDFVKITSFFSAEGLVADAIEVLDRRQAQFRFRGNITALDTGSEPPVITVLGVDVIIDADTSLRRRGNDSGNVVLATDLMVGELVNVSGGVRAGLLVANRIHIGSREQGNIELEGEIVAIEDGDTYLQITIRVEGNVLINIVMDGDTSVVGDLDQGVFVEVEGQLLEDLTLLAFEVVADIDGDGDADDDNDRGIRGDWHSDNGLGDVVGVEGDHNRDGIVDAVVEGRESILGAEGVDISGKVEIRHVAEGDDVNQKLVIEIEHGALETVYTLRIFFDDISVELGPVTSDAEGAFKVRFRTGAEDPGKVMENFLPMDLDVRNITGVQILLDGDVALEGDL